ncbi:Crp/Fnr family transcriptional regulator [Bradyrhizobium centrolobii]|nr:Crp/Fnr family transcriptional regulator [Bradyrhizobium centrolobii]
MFANTIDPTAKSPAFSPMKRVMVRNALLNGLPPEESAVIFPRLRSINFPRNAILREQRRPLETIGFVETGLVSLRRLSGESSIEIALVGPQGVLGASVLLGPRNSLYQSVAVTAGSLLTISADEFLAVIGDCPRLGERVLGNVHGLLLNSSQIALCGMRHSLEQRLAGWICYASETLGNSPIPVTQHYLSTVLGLRRAGVTEALIRFENEELITRARGTLRIRSSELLRQRACCCHSICAGGRCTSS